MLGGTWHGFSPRLTPSSAALLWKATLAAAGLAGFLLIAGAAFASVPRRAARWVAAIAAVKLGTFLAWAAASDAFDPVIFDSALTLAAILSLQLVAFARRRAASAPWIFAGIAFSTVAAAIEAIRPALSAPLGPDAVYHLIQTAGLFLFYRGGLLFSNAVRGHGAVQPSTSG